MSARESYRFDPDGNLVIKRETVLDDVFDACHEIAARTPEFGKFKGESALGHHVASVPCDVLMSLKESHGIDIFNMTPEMGRKLKRWLNTEAPRFKTINARL